MQLKFLSIDIRGYKQTTPTPAPPQQKLTNIYSPNSVQSWVVCAQEDAKGKEQSFHTIHSIGKHM